MPVLPTTPKGLKTRARLVDAARTIFATDGFVGARMSDVASEAKISLGALYRYFENKEHLFAALIADVHEELYMASRAQHVVFAADPHRALLEANFGYLKHYWANRDVMRAFIEAATVDTRFRDIWWQMRQRHTERFIRSLSDSGLLPSLDDAHVSIQAEAMACLVEQVAYVWFAQESLHDIGVSVAEAAQVVSSAWFRLFFCSDSSELTPADAIAFLKTLEADVVDTGTG